MYSKTPLMDDLLERINQDTFTLEGVSQETIDAMVMKGLIVETKQMTANVRRGPEGTNYNVYS